jgi:chromosome segregation ATPase
MSNVANASINNFASVAQHADVKLSEPIFVLSSSQLQEIITRAIQPLQDEVSDLKATVARQAEKITSLEATAKHQEDNQFIQLQLIGQLRETTKKEPQPLQRDRGDILRALLAANGGKMLAKDARRKMHLSESRFSELLSRMKDHIEKKPYHLDRTQNIIILK